MHTRTTGLGPTLRPAAAGALAAAVLLAACSAASPAPVPPSGTGRPSQSPPPVETVPPTATPITGEAPAAIIGAARADLATRIGADAAGGATVVRSEAVTWSDGSLGCPVPGEMYPQVLTPGYWIVFDAAGKTYDYRASETGFIRLCETARPTL